MLSISEDTATQIHKRNIFIKLEVCSYLFWVIDFALVQNRAQLEIRTKINETFDDMFSESKQWKKLKLKNLSTYLDDRLKNYAEISRAEQPFSAEYFERVIWYQTELILWILKKKKPLIGFIAVPKNEEEYQSVDLNILKRFKVDAPLKEAYASKIIPFTTFIMSEINDDYFIQNS